MSDVQIEKSLRFSFPLGWAPPIKYDDTAFYREQVLKPIEEIKAVDILAMTLAKGHLLLIEVKDFRARVQNSGRCDDYRRFTKIIARKTLHTVAGLYAAHRVGDDDLRAYAGRLMSNPERLEVVFFMVELPLPPSRTYDYRAIMLNRRHQLKGILDNLGFTAELYSLTVLPPPGPWTVTDLYTPPATSFPVIPTRP